MFKLNQTGSSLLVEATSLKSQLPSNSVSRSWTMESKFLIASPATSSSMGAMDTQSASSRISSWLSPVPALTLTTLSSAASNTTSIWTCGTTCHLWTLADITTQVAHFLTDLCLFSAALRTLARSTATRLNSMTTKLANLGAWSILRLSTFQTVKAAECLKSTTTRSSSLAVSQANLCAMPTISTLKSAQSAELPKPQYGIYLLTRCQLFWTNPQGWLWQLIGRTRKYSNMNMRANSKFLKTSKSPTKSDQDEFNYDISTTLKRESPH